MSNQRTDILYPIWVSAFSTGGTDDLSKKYKGIKADRKSFFNVRDRVYQEKLQISIHKIELSITQKMFEGTLDVCDWLRTVVT